VHESRPERAIGLVLIVRPAAEPQIRDRRAAAFRNRFDMIELE